MIAAILSALILPAQVQAPELELVEVWSTEVPLTTRVETRGYWEPHLLIDNVRIDPADGTVEQEPDNYFEFTSEAIPDLVKDPVKQLARDPNPKGPYGHVFIHRGEEFDYALSGPLHEDGYLWVARRLTTFDKDGNIVDETEAATPRQKVLGMRPVRIYRHVEERFFFARSHPSGDQNELIDTRFDGVMLLDPFRPSPLRVMIYHDLTNPHRALGVYVENFSEYLDHIDDTGLRYVVPSVPIVCGSIYTGKVYWVLNKNEYNWARYVGDHILTYNYQMRRWGTIQQDTGHVLRESDGTFNAMDFPELEGRSPHAGTVINGLVVIIRRGADVTKITSYRLEEKRVDRK